MYFLFTFRCCIFNFPVFVYKLHGTAKASLLHPQSVDESPQLLIELFHAAQLFTLLFAEFLMTGHSNPG